MLKEFRLILIRINTKTKEYLRGEQIFSENDLCDSIAIVKRGTIKAIHNYSDGHEKIISEYEGPAYYSPSSKRVQNSEGVWIALAGFVYLKQDICPDLIEFSGKVKINNSQFYQFRGMKSLNPDGSVNHVKLEVAV